MNEVDLFISLCKNAAVKKNMSLLQISKDADINYGALSCIWKGRTRLALTQAIRLSQVLEVSLDEVVVRAYSKELN